MIIDGRAYFRDRRDELSQKMRLDRIEKKRKLAKQQNTEWRDAQMVIKQTKELEETDSEIQES